MKTYTGRRVISVILALAVVFSMALTFVSAEDVKATVEGITYTANGDNTVTVTAANAMYVYDEVYIPETVEIGGKTYTVTAVGDNAFKDCDITYVSIPAGVSEIGANAFAGCTGLAKVTFFGEIGYIGANAFNDTAWYKNYPTDFVFASTPRGLNYLIGYKASAEDTEKDITIPMTVDVIGEYAFAGNTGIESVRIPARTSKILAHAFDGCENLKRVTVGASDLNEVGRDAFAGTPWLAGYLGDYVIVGNFMIKYAGDDEFVYIPNTVKSVADYCFEGCKSVVAVRVPMSVTNIGENAFFLFNDNGNDKYAEVYTWKNAAAAACADELGVRVNYLYMPGDINCDGNVRADDARDCLRCAAKLYDLKNDAAFVAGDINCDNSIRANDARTILRLAAGLEDFTSEDLLYKPNTSFEILMAYAESVRFAIRKQAGYDLKEYQKNDDVNVAPAWFRSFLSNPFQTSLTKEKKAKTVSLEQDSEEAINRLYECGLSDSNLIKSATCVISDDHRYYEIRIALADELDVEGTDSLTSLIFPVAAKEDFVKILNDKESIWYNASLTDFNFDVYYSGCNLDAKVKIASGGLENLVLKSGYRFEMWGKVNGIKIYRKESDKSVPNQDENVGIVKRTDTAVYSAFKYMPEEFEKIENPEFTTRAPETTAPAATEPAKDDGGDKGGLDLAGIGDKLGGVVDTIGGLVGDVDLGGIADTVGGLVGGIDLGSIGDTIGGLLG